MIYCTKATILGGFDPHIVLRPVRTIIEDHRPDSFQNKYVIITPDYNFNNTSWRVLKLILGNTKLSNKWLGINEK